MRGQTRSRLIQTDLETVALQRQQRLGVVAGIIDDSAITE